MVGNPSKTPKCVFFNLTGFIFIDQSQAVALVGPFITDINPDIVVFRNLLMTIRISEPEYPAVV